MSRWSLSLAVLLAGCAATTAPSPPAPAMVIPHGTLGTSYVLAGAAVEHEGTTHLWAVLASGVEGDPQRVVHLTSSDLRTWDGDRTASVLDGAALEFDANGAIPSSVLIEEDGTWRLFGGGRLADGDTPVIWTASAPGADGPWSFHPTPILQPERVGWDGVIADHPSVVRTDNGYLMAYGGAGAGAPNRNRIGFARSTDGISWIRVPTTLEAADDDLALGPAACGIDARTMAEPELRQTDAGLRLDFGLIEVGADKMVIASTVSTDGGDWECGADGAVFDVAEVDPARNLHSFVPLRIGERDAFLVELIAPGSLSSDLWLVER